MSILTDMAPHGALYTIEQFEEMSRAKGEDDFETIQKIVLRPKTIVNR